MIDRQLRLCCMSLVSIVLSCTPTRSADRSGRPLLENVKATRISILGASEDDVTLERWLQTTFPAATTFDWETTSCELKPGGLSSPSGWPMCVTVHARSHGGAYLRLHLEVGTLERGVSGTPHVSEASWMSWPCGSGSTPPPLVRVRALSEIPRNLIAARRQECL